MKFRSYLLAAAGLILIAQNPVSAMPMMPIPALVDGLFNTGVADDGSLLAPGDNELHYITTGPASADMVITPNSAWVTDSDANWIGPTSGTSNAPLGGYSYSISFDLSAFDISTVIIDGKWASDNNSEIFLNGNPTGFTGNVLAFQALDSFALSSGFVSGTNTLTFQVLNPGAPSPNPTGLIVTDLSGNGILVPEPASLVLCGVGGVALMNRRRK